jgi:thioredoxin-like negative regulator of GroEL
MNNLEYGNLEDIIKNNDVVFFVMNDCSACENFVVMAKKILESKLRFCIMNVDESQFAKIIAVNIGVRAFPTIVLIKNEEMKQYVGNYSENKFKSILKDFFSIDF